MHRSTSHLFKCSAHKLYFDVLKKEAAHFDSLFLSMLCGADFCKM